MKIYNKIKQFTLLGMLVTQGLFAQMNTWVTPPIQYNMTSIVTPTSPLYSGAPSSGGYEVANGAHDIDGTLLFYVQGTNVMNPNGTVAGELGGTFTSTGFYAQNSAFIQGEIAIVPIPGECKKFYVIYVRANGMYDAATFYTKVDCSSGTVNVINNGSIVYFYGPMGSSGPLFHGYPAFPIGGTGVATAGIAVSQIVSGSNASALRYLYTCGTNGIIKYDITSSGINNATPFVIAGLTSSDYATLELELSPNRDYLAWSSISGATPTNYVHIIKLVTSTGIYDPGTLKSTSLNSIKGLEFDKSAMPMLYVIGGTTALNIYAKINASTNAYTAITATGYDLSNSFLELGKNGRMYAIAQGATPKLASIVLPSGAITAGFTKAIYFDSRHNYTPWSSVGSVYTLPDQVDGQNYNDFGGYSVVSINPLSINSLQLNYSIGSGMIFIQQGDCDNGGIREVYTCNPVTLNTSFTGGTPSQYKIDITSVDASCVPVSGGTHMTYVGSWTSGSVPSSLDLRSLTDGSGNTLYTSSGNHYITVSVKNACGNITMQSGYFNVLSAIVNTNLEIYDYTNPGVYLLPSHSLSSPNLVGTASIGFRVNNSTGNFTSMQVKVDKYYSGTGTYGNVLTETKTYSGSTALTYESLNGYCVPLSANAWAALPGVGASCTTNPGAVTGEKGFFACSNGLYSYNNTYSLTVTLSNACGSSSAYAIIKPVAINQRLANTNTDTEINGNKALIYPNPSINEFNINLINNADDVYTINLYDVTGKLIKYIATNMAFTKGSQTIQVSTVDLPQGIYTYKINSTNLNTSGLISISK